VQGSIHFEPCALSSNKLLLGKTDEDHRNLANALIVRSATSTALKFSEVIVIFRPAGRI
jgi:hypothetical protein